MDGDTWTLTAAAYTVYGYHRHFGGLTNCKLATRHLPTLASSNLRDCQLLGPRAEGRAEGAEKPKCCNQSQSMSPNHLVSSLTSRLANNNNDNNNKSGGEKTEKRCFRFYFETSAHCDLALSLSACTRPNVEIPKPQSASQQNMTVSIQSCSLSHLVPEPLIPPFRQSFCHTAALLHCSTALSELRAESVCSTGSSVASERCRRTFCSKAKADFQTFTDWAFQDIAA